MLTRRALVIGGAQATLFSVLGLRMYDLQVRQGEQYRLLAEDNRINLHLIPPTRGHLLDRNGAVLAQNKPNYRVLVVPEQTRSLAETLDALGDILAISPDERERVLREAKRKRSFVPIMIAENLDWETFAAVNARGPELPGALPDVGAAREYPGGHSVAHILGYVGAVSKEELTGDPILQVPGFQVGKSGVEKNQDIALRGKTGNRRVEVNSLGRIIRELDRDEPVPGDDVALTIDLELQKAVVERLGEESAAACVMDVRSGAVLALASNPTFDPNLLATGVSRQQWRELISNERKPLMNKALAGQYPPGSTFKMITAMAALQANVISSTEKITCRGKIKLGKSTFHCWKRGGHGAVNMRDALKKSCDIYFYEAAKRTGIDDLAEMARAFGIGERLGIGIPGEKPGLMPSRGWKLATKGERWQGGETLITGIGQGAVLATPIQLATMAARIANGGLAIQPQLYRTIGGKPVTPKPVSQINVPPGAVRIVQEGMNAVVNQPGGTARRSRIDKPGWEMAGKTGTAQVKRITKAERAAGVTKNKDRPWKDRDHALFVAFAPYHNPQFAVSVIVEHGGSGSGVAAPVARDILIETMERDPLRLATMSEEARG